MPVSWKIHAQVYMRIAVWCGGVPVKKTTPSLSGCIRHQVEANVDYMAPEIGQGVERAIQIGYIFP